MANGTLKVSNIETSSGSGTITLGQSGETITVPSGATLNLSNATQTGVGGANTPMAAGYLTSNQTVSDNTPTKVQFNAEYYDTDSAYDKDTNYRFTVPSGKGGKYFIHAAVYGFGNNNDERELGLDIYKNGAVIRRQYMGNSGFSTGAPSAATITATTIADLSASDYIEFYAFVNVDSGTPAFFGSSTLTNIYTYFNIAKMIE